MDRHNARLLLADDHKLLAEACKKLLEPEFQVLAVVEDGRSLVKAARDLRPDVVILDIGMPELNGLDAGEQIKRTLPHAKLVFLTMVTAPDVAAEAFRRGASGYVVKQAAADELLTAVRKVLRGESYMSSAITRETVQFLLRTGATPSHEKQITGRQREVLQLLAEGKSMKEIASILNIQTGTVAFHKYKMMETLGVKTNAELLQYAIKNHVVA